MATVFFTIDKKRFAEIQKNVHNAQNIILTYGTLFYNKPTPEEIEENCVGKITAKRVGNSEEEFKTVVYYKSIFNYNRNSIYTYYDDIKMYVPYVEKQNIIEKQTLHFGQLKLLLTLLHFLRTECSDIKNGKKTVLIYAGAAAGMNIFLSYEYFKHIIDEWVLIDPARFDPRLFKLKNVVILNNFFTDKLATELYEQYCDYNIIYISDIRISPEEERIMSDMSDQLRWYYILKPYKTQFKFRLPWQYSKGEFFPYLSGKQVIQPYAPPNSSESRLVIDGPNARIKHYDLTKYDGKCFTFNNYYRQSNYSNFLGFDLTKYGYDNCCDCARFFVEASNYVSSKNDIIETIKLMNKWVSILSPTRTVVADVATKLKKFKSVSCV